MVKRGRKSKGSGARKRRKESNAKTCEDQAMLLDIVTEVFSNLRKGRKASTATHSTQTVLEHVHKSTQTNPPRKRTATPDRPALKPRKSKYKSKYSQQANDVLQDKTMAPCK